jgi:DNA polymerase III gamma/tau subunit
MSEFLVSARKYRPQTFDQVVGQSSVTSTLQNAIKSNQLAQSFLFCGPRGIGKTTCAKGKSIDEVASQMKKSVPMNRFGNSNEVANAVVFLSSIKASYINGINLPVDGGRTASL